MPVWLPASVSSGVAITDDLASVVDRFDVLIDFTAPEASLVHLELCRANGKRMVIGTTGFSDEQKQQIEAAVDRISPSCLRPT